LKETSNIMSHYHEFWEFHSLQDNWREYILPKRSDLEFYNEGVLESEKLNNSGLFSNNATVLEFGCGVARVLKHINVPHENKIGVDVCQSYLDKITEPIKKIKTDGIVIPDMEKESVDFIYSLMVFQHINKKDHKTLINQLYDFLKPGGKMYIQFPTDTNDYYTSSPFVNLYSIDELTSYFDKSMDIEIETGNLCGYGDGLVSLDTPHREYFVTVKK